MAPIVSSAVAGKQAAPKVPVRRRAPLPPAVTATAAQLVPVIEIATTTSKASGAPSLPNTSSTASGVVAIAAEARVDAHTSEIERFSPPTTHPTRAEQVYLREAPPHPDHQDLISAIVNQSNASVSSTTRTSDAAKTVALATSKQQRDITTIPQQSEATPVSQSRKRKSESGPRQPAPLAALADQPAKRAKRSSARVNALVQARMNEDSLLASSKRSTISQSSTTARTYAPNSSSAKIAAKPVSRKAALPSSPVSGLATSKPGPTTRRMKAAQSQVPATVLSPRPKPSAKRLPGRRGATASEAQPDELPAVPYAGGAGKQKPPRRKSSTSKPAGSESAEAQYIADQPQKRGRRKKAAQPPKRVESGDDVESNTSDPELHEIDPNTLTMYELSNDARHGKLSEREKKMADIDWTEVARKRQEAISRVVQTGADQQQAVMPSGVEGAALSTEAENAAAENADIETGPMSAPQFQIVNGQIVENESSLVIAPAAQPAAAEEEPIEEENDLTRRLNRTTWLNARRRDPAERLPTAARAPSTGQWSDEETDRFYDALRMFGTDFFIISKMFAPRTRKQIKHKFVREERLEPQRVRTALMGGTSKPMDLEYYARETGRDLESFQKYEDVAHAEKVIREGLQSKEEEMRAAVAERAEEDRQREVQERQREHAKVATEKRKEERAAAKAAKIAAKEAAKVGGRGRGVAGSGTLGG